MTVDMTKQYDKNATVKITLKADSKYSEKVEARISAFQWGEINRILNMSVEAARNEGAPSEQSSAHNEARSNGPASPVDRPGWVAVPVEPTEEMIDAGRAVGIPTQSIETNRRQIWAAMLAASPPQVN